ncbi:MAG TPA: SusE domain-containing protein [Chitinophagaceae bacterium]|nr:SusE domain-containing protein [Chitinophagaceae bacterium]
MKNIYKLLSALILLSALNACQKLAPLPHYANGSSPTLSASTNTIVPSSADSSKEVLTLSWSNPKYATDSSNQKFIVELDSSGRNFAHEVTVEVDGPLSYSFTGSQLNNILANFGFAAGQPFKVDARVTSSYANNNEQYKSNVVTITMTPYLVPITLTPSSTDPLVLQVTNGNNTAVSFSWNASTYGNNSINYALQIDTAGDNFANPQVKQYGTALNADLIENDLNTAAINAGAIGGSTKNIEFRIVSYTDNTYATPLVTSNVVTISVTTYTPVPPDLYIVGDATAGGWNNPVPTPAQQFYKVDAYSYSIIVNLTAGKSYLFLPVNGDWSHKYGGATDGVGTAGTLLKDDAVPGSNTPAPSSSGLYDIVVNFQTNKYTVTPVSVPSNLYIVGDATVGGWNNPVPTPSQQFTQLSPGVFGIITNLNAGAGYLFLPVNGDWSHKYGGATDGVATPGILLADGAVPGSNTPAPSPTGVYEILVNFATNTYTVTPYTGAPLPSNLYIVGDATAGGWNNPVPVPSQQFTQLSNAEFTITLPLSGQPASYLFLPVNGDWSHKFGGTGATGGTLLYDGAVPGSNTPGPASAGTYTIDVNFITDTYSVQ